MLTTYRRHVKICGHRAEGRKYRRCRCPIWVDGFLNGVEMRKSLNLRDWEKAQQRIRDWEAEGQPVPEPPEVLSINQARKDFMNDAEARGLQDSTLKKYRVLFNQMESHAAKLGYPFLKQWEDLQVVRGFRESWSDKGISAVKKLERLKAFYRFAQESGWIGENPAMKLKNPEVKQPPTMPYTQEEMIRMLAACDKYTDTYGRIGQPNSKRLRPFVLLMRYSGLRIGDTVTCSTDRIVGNKLFLYTHKTNVPVYCKLPECALEALQSMPKVSERYFFWTGAGKADTAAGNYRRSLRGLFALAEIKGGHPHRFRDTFAVELLLAGVPLERVSVLLGHSSIKVTEKHYSPWVRARQEQLEADLERSWERDPIVLAATKGTPGVHRKTDLVS
jgi:integrase/recombinase XerD